LRSAMGLPWVRQEPFRSFCPARRGFPEWRPEIAQMALDLMERPTTLARGTAEAKNKCVAKLGSDRPLLKRLIRRSGAS
jgi:hypothetical protein